MARAAWASCGMLFLSAKYLSIVWVVWGLKFKVFAKAIFFFFFLLAHFSVI